MLAARAPSRVQVAVARPTATATWPAAPPPWSDPARHLAEDPNDPTAAGGVDPARGRHQPPLEQRQLQLLLHTCCRPCSLSISTAAVAAARSSASQSSPPEAPVIATARPLSSRETGKQKPPLTTSSRAGGARESAACGFSPQKRWQPRRKRPNPCEGRPRPLTGGAQKFRLTKCAPSCRPTFP